MFVVRVQPLGNVNVRWLSVCPNTLRNMQNDPGYVYVIPFIEDQ